MDYTTPSCNREYNGSIPDNIPNLQLHGYSNAAFTDLINRKLTFSYIYKLADSPDLYKLNKQSILTTLTTEAKYIAIIYVVKKALWLK